MNLPVLAYKNILSKPLGSLLSILLLAMGTGLISILLHADRRIQENLENNLESIDMVVGAKGSPLQLILSAVYHVDDPTGNIPLADARRVMQHPMVGKSVMLAYGDYYEGYRILGTTHQYPEWYSATIAEGRLWEDQMEVCVGHALARKLGLSLGDRFVGTHGKDAGHVHDDKPYTVVGIFEPVNAVIDNLLLTSIESVWSVHDDDIPEGEDVFSVSSEGKEVTALLVQFRNPIGLIQLPAFVNDQTTLQAAIPVYEISRLMNLLGIGFDGLRFIAWLIIGVSALSILFALLQSLRERRHELALIRSWGAGKSTLFLLLLYEGLLLSWVGYICGILASRLLLWIFATVAPQMELYGIRPYWTTREELWLLLAVSILGLLSAALPAWQAVRVNISKTLSHA